MFLSANPLQCPQGEQFSLFYSGDRILSSSMETNSPLFSVIIISVIIIKYKWVSDEIVAFIIGWYRFCNRIECFIDIAESLVTTFTRFFMRRWYNNAESLSLVFFVPRDMINQQYQGHMNTVFYTTGVDQYSTIYI